MTNRDKDLRRLFFDSVKKRYEQCLWPGCRGKVIRAHSIQNRKVLDRIAEEGHVVMPVLTVDADCEASYAFRDVGRNKATTFTGLCSAHDREIFLPIDTEQIDVSKPEHLFLLAFRSVLRELHTWCKAMTSVSHAYRGKAGIDSKSAEEIDSGAVEAAVTLNQAHACFQYAFPYYMAYMQGSFDVVQHKVLKVRNVAPTLAVSSFCMSADSIQNPQHPETFVLNVFPIDGDLAIVFTFVKADAQYVLPHFSELLEATRKRGQLRILSKIILRNCENFVMRPSCWKAMSRLKREAIVNYLNETCDTDASGTKRPGLMLF